MTLNETNKAVEFFKNKLEFTTGPVEVKRMLDENQPVKILDVREPDAFAAGHVPEALNLPKNRWNSAAHLPHDKTLIFYCYSHVCHLAAQAALHFAGRGFAVMEMDGGFDQWQKHNMPVEK